MPMPEVSPDARVFFVAPADGATVVGPLVDGKVAVHVEMGAENLRVMRAGELAEGAGHHHIIIDGDGVPRGEAVPATPTHIHYGLAQTEAEANKPPETRITFTAVIFMLFIIFFFVLPILRAIFGLGGGRHHGSRSGPIAPLWSR